MTTATMPTANGVSRTLGRAFKRSETHATRVRGYNETTRGFRVYTDEYSGWVVVAHVHPRGVFSRDAFTDRNQDRDQVRTNWLNRYATHLERAGYTIEFGTDGTERALLVTGRTNA